MFLLEGLPCVLLGLISLSYIVDRPSQAKWMTPAEIDYLSARTERATAGGPNAHPGFLQVARDPKVLLLGTSYFCIICGHYTVSFWLPTMLRSAGVISTMEIGLYSAIPDSIAIVVMVWWGRRSDRMAERRWHSSSMLLIASVAMLVAALNGTSLTITLASISIATAALWAAYTVFWAIPSDYIKGEGAAGGIALVNTIGLFGGFFSPTIIGYFKTLTGNMQSGLLGMTGILLVGTVLLVVNRIPAPASAGQARTTE